MKKMFFAIALFFTATAQADNYSAGIHSGTMVMQQGQALRGNVIQVRGVKIAAPAQQRSTTASMVSAGATLVGGLLGRQAGRPGSTESLIGAVVGAIGGGMAANAVMTSSDKPFVEGQEILIEANGRVLVIVQAESQQLAAGDEVWVITTGSQTRVVAAARPAAQSDSM